MADVNNVISLGIGSPASIEHFILFGLNANPAVAPSTPSGTGGIPVFTSARLYAIQGEPTEAIKTEKTGTVQNG